MPDFRALYIGDTNIAGAPPLAAFDIPVRDNLAGAFLLGDGEQVGMTNWSGGADAVAVGSVDWRNGYARMPDGAYLQTGAAETLAMTLLVVARRVTPETSVGFLGNWNAANGGVGLLVQNTPTSYLRQAASRTDTNSSTTQVPASSVQDWFLGTLVVPATGAGLVRHVTAGVSNVTAATDRALGSNGPLRIGGIPAYAAACDVAIAVAYQSALSDVDLTLMISWAREYAARHGITV